MRFDIFSWDEVPVNKAVTGVPGRLSVVCSMPSMLFVESEGYEVLLGQGLRFDVRLSAEYRFRVKSDKDCRVFRRGFGSMAVESSGAILTNANPTMGREGSVMWEVKRALREQQLRERERDRAFRAQTSALKAERAALERARAAAEAPAPAAAPAVPEGGVDASAS